MISPSDLSRRNNDNELDWQTSLSVLIGTKSISGALANLYRAGAKLKHIKFLSRQFLTLSKYDCRIT
jgi:hypothetical protein